MRDSVRNWYDNVWCQRRLLRNREYRHYYCNLWCFLTNQMLCRGLR